MGSWSISLSSNWTIRGHRILELRKQVTTFPLILDLWFFLLSYMNGTRFNVLGTSLSFLRSVAFVWYIYVLQTDTNPPFSRSSFLFKPQARLLGDPKLIRQMWTKQTKKIKPSRKYEQRRCELRKPFERKTKIPDICPVRWAPAWVEIATSFTLRRD